MTEDGMASVSPWDDLMGPLRHRWSPREFDAEHHLSGHADWEYSEFSQYDLGQAVAHMTIQAQSMGIACRQFRAFDREAVSGLLDVPEHWDVMTMTAIGRPASTAERGPRASTREVSIVWPRR